MSDEREPEAIVWNLVRGTLTSRAIGVVADLRIADAPLAAGALAESAGLDVVSVEDGLIQARCR